MPPSSRPARSARTPVAVVEALRLLTVVFFAGAGYAIGSDVGPAHAVLGSASSLDIEGQPALDKARRPAASNPVPPARRQGHGHQRVEAVVTDAGDAQRIDGVGDHRQPFAAEGAQFAEEGEDRGRAEGDQGLYFSRLANNSWVASINAAVSPKSPRIASCVVMRPVLESAGRGLSPLATLAAMGPPVAPVGPMTSPT